MSHARGQKGLHKSDEVLGRDELLVVEPVNLGMHHLAERILVLIACQARSDAAESIVIVPADGLVSQRLAVDLDLVHQLVDAFLYSLGPVATYAVAETVAEL